MPIAMLRFSVRASPVTGFFAVSVSLALFLFNSLFLLLLFGIILNKHLAIVIEKNLSA